MYKVEEFISEDKVALRIKELAAEINRDYDGKAVHLICILKGSAPFMCELAKQLTVPVTMDFMAVSSYGSGTRSSGHIKILKDLEEPIENRHVLVIEDIIDSGRTLNHIVNFINTKKPADIRLCTLLDKPDRRVVHDINVDYTGFVIPDVFVVGCGLDYDQLYRNLPYIGIVKFD